MVSQSSSNCGIIIADQSIGFMGTAILKGALRRPAIVQSTTKHSWAASVRSPGSLERLKREILPLDSKVDVSHGMQDATRIAADANIVILGCAPTDLGSLISNPDIATSLKGKTVVSLLAGVSYARLKAMMASRGAGRHSTFFARVLPSLGAQIGQSVSLVADQEGGCPDPERMREVDDLFSSIGTVTHVSETLMAEATAISAAAHALNIVATDAIADVSATEGLSRASAMSIVQQCFASAGALGQSGMSPEQMKDAMAIPNGITINAVLQLARAGRPALAEGVRKAIEHSRRM